MTNDEIIYLNYIRSFIKDHPHLLNEALQACTDGLKDKLAEARQKASDMETCFMHHVAINKIPGQEYITYKTIAAKLKEMENKKYLNFQWDHIIEAMENSPEELSGKRKRK